MAFLKFANAVVRKIAVQKEDWSAVTRRATSFSDRTSSVAIQNYSPDKYLLTHCTIICSVDTEAPVGVKTGSVEENGFKVNRKYANYWITPETLKGINCNGDSWDRELLLKTYKTFIGAENYCEHIQIPELSKGKVIDAVARDLGDHVYVDILVATDRKHKDLIAQIEAGEINTMSMGCTIAFSQCTKCGNVAEDDTQMCPCIRYEKGNKFIRPDGKTGIVAELCGHKSEPESVTFIEASWVANPAFKGAVMRNILNPGQVGAVGMADSDGDEDRLASLIHMAHHAPRPAQDDWAQYFKKTASALVREEVQEALRQASVMARHDVLHGLGRKRHAYEEEGGEGGGDAAGPADPMEALTEEIKKKIRQRALDELKREVSPEPPKKDMPAAEEAPNENIIQSALRHRVPRSLTASPAYQAFAKRYARDLQGRNAATVYAAMQSLRSAKTHDKYRNRFAARDVVTAMYLLDRDVRGQVLASDVYACLLRVGHAGNYGGVKPYLKACLAHMGRKITAREAKELIVRGMALPDRKK